MKKMALLIACLLLVSATTQVYATTNSGGDNLKLYGFITGDDRGNLNESDPLTRAQLMVLMSQLNGVFSDAKNYKTTGKFTDVNYRSDWYAPYVSYAEYKGWTTGYPDGTFKPNGVVTDKELATVLYKALSYPISDLNFDTITTNMISKGIPINATNKNSLKRGEAFEALWISVNSIPYLSEVTLGEKLGKFTKKDVTSNTSTPFSSEIQIIGAKPLGLDVIEVIFNKDVNTISSKHMGNYTIKEKNTNTNVEIKNIHNVSPDRVLLKTKPLNAKKSYSLTVNGVTRTFFSISESSSKPVTQSVKAIDTNLIEITFNKPIDFESAINANSYKLNNNAYVEKVALNAGHRSITLSTKGVDKKKPYSLTMSNIKSVDGVLMTTVTKLFTGNPDTTAPVIKRIEPITNSVIHIHFNDMHGIDKDMIEDTSNWSIDNNAEINSIISKKSKGNMYYDYVIVDTSELKFSKKHTFKINGLTDGSTSKNISSKLTQKSFYPKKIDTIAPKFSSNIEVLNDNTLLLSFTDSSTLDSESLFDFSNYTLSGKLQVKKILWFDDQANKYTAEGQKILLMTSSQSAGTSYKITVENVRDEFGNEMTKPMNARWTARADNLSAPTVTNLNVKDATTVELTFSHPVEKESAENINNYFVTDIGKPVISKVVSGASNTVILKLPEGVAGAVYSLTINGVGDYYSNEIENLIVNYTSFKESISLPEFNVIKAFIVNSNEIRVTFNSTIDLNLDTQLNLKHSTSTENVVDVSAQLSGVIDGEYVFLTSDSSSLSTDTSTYSIHSFISNGMTLKNSDGLELNEMSFKDLILYSIQNTIVQPDVISIDHIDSNTISVQFSEAMLLEDSNVTYSTSSIDFTEIKVDEMNNSIVYFASDTIITEDATIIMNFSNVEGLQSINDKDVVSKDIIVNTFSFISE